VKRGNPELRLRLPRIEPRPKPVHIKSFQDFAGVARRPDLLEARGIMHLHLGGKNSDIVLFLIQYADQVVLLETNSHVHFRTQPAGKNILALSQSWLSHLEREMDDAAVRRDAGEAERDRAETRRAEIAAAIAAFKAKAGIG
jgi:hypothetical protein